MRALKFSPGIAIREPLKLPLLRTVRLLDISTTAEFQCAGYILKGARRIQEIELRCKRQLQATTSAGVHLEVVTHIFSVLAKHKPRVVVFEMFCLLGLPPGFLSEESLQDLTLRSCEGLASLDFHKKRYRLTKIHLLVDSTDMVFARQLIERTRLSPGLKTLVLLIKLNQSNIILLGTPPPDWFAGLPFSVEVLDRHEASLENLAIHVVHQREMSPSWHLIQPDCFASLKDFKKLKEISFSPDIEITELDDIGVS